MDLTSVFLSLKIASVAVAVVFLIALPLARVTARRHFPGKDIFEAVLVLPLVLPPSVVGFFLLYLLGRTGPLGYFLESNFDIQVVFTWVGAVTAAAVVAFPLMYRPLKSSIEEVDERLEQAARVLGAGEFKIFWTVTLPLAWPGLVAGVVMAFTRALGEFGATLIVAGNIPGRTQTMPLAIYQAIETGEMEQVLGLVLFLTLFSFIVVLFSNRWTRKKRLQLEGR